MFHFSIVNYCAATKYSYVDRMARNDLETSMVQRYIKYLTHVPKRSFK